MKPSLPFIAAALIAAGACLVYASANAQTDSQVEGIKAPPSVLMIDPDTTSDETIGEWLTENCASETCVVINKTGTDNLESALADAKQQILILRSLVERQEEFIQNGKCI